MKFLAEIKKTSQRKAASLDNIYQVVLETNDPKILDLGKLSPETLVAVEVKNAN